MTTRWAVPPDLWAGETVAILGAGPDMTADLASSAKGYKTVAVNRAVKFAPWADMFVALDPKHPFYTDPGDFAGMRICGVECELDALYPEYGFGQHKGYGTAEHLAALRRHGPCPLHRRSFRGVKELIPK